MDTDTQYYDRLADKLIAAPSVRNPPLEPAVQPMIAP